MFPSLADRYCDMLVNANVLPPIRLLLESPNADHKNIRQLCEQTLDWVQQFLFVDNYYQKKFRVNYRVYKLRKSDSFDSLSHVVKHFYRIK